MKNDQASKVALELLARQQRSFEIRLRGSSMTPTIPDGALVRIDSAAAIVPGAVVAFRDGDRIIGHRLLFVARNMMILLGDGYTTTDLPIALDRALGCVVEWLDGNEWRAVGPRAQQSIWSQIAAFLVISALRISPLLARKTAASLILLARRQRR